jgi:hypothetical protein
MEAVEEIKDITSHSPKLTFRFLIDESETLYDGVSIKETGFRWIYQEETISSTILESNDQDEETVPPTKKLKHRVKKKKKSKQHVLIGTLKIILLICIVIMLGFQKLFIPMQERHLWNSNSKPRIRDINSVSQCLTD